MSHTLVLQSHREPLPWTWLANCLDSVADWARRNGFDYRFIGDELFTALDPEMRGLAAERPVVASDLARLFWLRRAVDEGYERAVWCDADFLVFAPERLRLPCGDFALGREVWVQQDRKRRWRVHIKVHNAFLLFRRGNAFLDFYIDTAARLLRLNAGGVPPQFIGPKLLTALHNIAHFPVLEEAGMLSPPVIRDLLEGGGGALDLFVERSPAIPAGVNLAASLAAEAGLDEPGMERVIRGLLEKGFPLAKCQSMDGGGSSKA